MPRFVLLEHRWNGVHWDLMFETAPGGLMPTWAIDAPVVPGRDLPARRLADHRAAYLDYEGEISGGRGTVRRVDRGVYEPLAWTDDLVRVRLEGAQLVGLAVLRRAVVGTWGTRTAGARGSASGSDPASAPPSVPDPDSAPAGSYSSSWNFRLGNLA